MASLRQLLIASAIPASLVACGGGGDDGPTEPTGEHYTYVTDSVKVPASNSEARMIGLDLNDDDTIDNTLGMVLAFLGGQGLNIQESLDEAINDGSIILLLDLQTPSFDSTSGAGLSIKLGQNPSPAACTDPEMPATCGQHLMGGAMFSISPDSPPNAGVTGRIAAGTFNGGPGTISLQISLGEGDPIQLDLIGARAQASGMSEGGISKVVLGGALTQQDLDTKVIPTIHTQIQPIIDRDCTGTAPPDPCGCTGTGKTIVGLLDEDENCDVTVDEIKNNQTIASLLAPDVTIDGQEALSIGLQATAIDAVFPTE